MKDIIKYTKSIATALLIVSGSLTSCDYLDVVPPEQASLPDATKTENATLGFLYSCYAAVPNTGNYSGQTENGGVDEYTIPGEWGEASISMATNNFTTAASPEWKWGNYYRYIGQCHLFLQQLEKTSAVSEEKKVNWKAEANFLIAYYHFLLLQFYGPIPINDHYIDMDTSSEDFPGRSHFDYVVDWIANKLDTEVIPNLPATRSGDEWGRATSVIAKAIKARMYLYAASPLWNGSFPYSDADWRNDTWETPGYGKSVVSHSYEANKWERARSACQEALDAALAAGHKLYDNINYYMTTDPQAQTLPYIPGLVETGPEAEAAKEFKKRVMMFRYLVTTRADQGNEEIIWGKWGGMGSTANASMPLKVIRNTSSGWNEGWSGISPLLSTITNFYTKNGKLPAKDPNFIKENEWYNSAGLTGATEEETSYRTNIIKLNLNREARYYAWMAFDGGDYGVKLFDGKPLMLDMKSNTSTTTSGQRGGQGYDPTQERNRSLTGFLSQKFVYPLIQKTANSTTGDQNSPMPMIRIAELYLNLAECEAAISELNNNDTYRTNAFTHLNKIRERAGIPNLTESMITESGMNLVDWILNERFIELWGEGFRYYDIRRWILAPNLLGERMREGLYADKVENPAFEDFNRPTPITSIGYKWTKRQYLGSLYYIEVAKNPNMLQAPGY